MIRLHIPVRDEERFIYFKNEMNGKVLKIMSISRIVVPAYIYPSGSEEVVPKELGRLFDFWGEDYFFYFRSTPYHHFWLIEDILEEGEEIPDSDSSCAGAEFILQTIFETITRDARDLIYYEVSELRDMGHCLDWLVEYSQYSGDYSWIRGRKISARYTCINYSHICEFLGREKQPIPKKLKRFVSRLTGEKID